MEPFALVTFLLDLLGLSQYSKVHGSYPGKQPQPTSLERLSNSTYFFPGPLKTPFIADITTLRWSNTGSLEDEIAPST